MYLEWIRQYISAYDVFTYDRQDASACDRQYISAYDVASACDDVFECDEPTNLYSSSTKNRWIRSRNYRLSGVLVFGSDS